MPSKPILQVEDDRNDVLFLQMAVKRAAVEIPVQVVTDGKQAIDYLVGVGKFIDREEYPLPAVVLLDLRLPRVPGHEVLRWIRRQPQFAALPVIILSASAADSDINQAYGLGASSYIVKPSNPAELVQIVQLIRDYWLQGKTPPPEIDHFSIRPVQERAIALVPEFSRTQR